MRPSKPHPKRRPDEPKSQTTQIQENLIPQGKAQNRDFDQDLQLPEKPQKGASGYD